MTILIEIGHPAHVHFFQKAMGILKNKGLNFLIVTRNKEITNALLDRFGIPYRCLSAPPRRPGGLPMELACRWWKMAVTLGRERPVLAASISGISTSVPARLMGVRNLIFTDTEDARWSNWMAFPFADAIYTPDYFLDDLGPRHRRYPGLHELAYLQHFDFAAARTVRRNLGLPERYVIIRLIAHDALHDQDIVGMTGAQVSAMVEKASTFGKVFICSQAQLSPSLERHALQVPIESVHAILAGAQMFLGESPTMAVESSLLGVPAFLVSQRVHRLGNMIRLAQMKLLCNCRSWSELDRVLPAPADAERLQAQWTERARTFRESVPDMTEFLVGTLERAAQGGVR